MNLRISPSPLPLLSPLQPGQHPRPVQSDPAPEQRDHLHFNAVTRLQGVVPGESVFASHENGLQEMQKIRPSTFSLAELPDFSVHPLRIGVGIGLSNASFSFAKGQLKVDTPQGTRDLGLFENVRFQVTALPGGFQLQTADGKYLGSYEGVLRLESNEGPVSLNGARYRGSLEIRPHPDNPSRFNLINTVMLEDYLLSVVPSESPASWPIESLKAQAMAARTYAVANWRKREALGFDMNTDTSDQMYTGIQGEQPASSEAVKATQNQIIVYQGKPITALFFSSSGGSTDSSLEVWGVDLPYIQPVKDFDQAAPRYRWDKTMTQSQLQAALTKLGVNVGSLRKIEILETTSQGRVKRIRFSGSNGSAEVDSNKFRFASGLSSTRWTVSADGNPPRSFRFDGGGWGHGLGMSQWGARQMAADGKSAAEIIHHYYTGVEIQSLQAEETPSTPAEPATP